MFKKNLFKILATTFFLLSGVTFYYSSKAIKIKPSKIIVKGSGNPTHTISVEHGLKSFPINDSNNGTIIARPPSDEAGNAPTLIPTQQLQPISANHRLLITDTPMPVQPTPTGSIDSTKLTVSLSIAGSSVGSFEIPQGSNQCDVLTQALSQGKIQSLNMRYNSDMGTNAVYQINGVGKENSVWWTFKVNGQSPSQGCSYIKTNSGDSVLWEYIGN